MPRGGAGFALKLVDLDEGDRALLEKTRRVLREKGTEISGVSAGLVTSKGNEFFGLCIDARTATVGICAEYSAIGAMVTNGEKEIETIVAVNHRTETRFGILPPCGKCRDFIRAFGDPYVILQHGRRAGDAKKVKLSELVPAPWNEV